MQIDHVFIRAHNGAPEANLLKTFGLVEGSSNKHPGQGTENRRFFFRNAFIELIWIADYAEIQSQETQATNLFERISGQPAQASPFGICFRPATGEPSAPFPSWNYRPAYLPAGLDVQIGQGVPLSEPMWFFLAKGTRPDALPAQRQQPLVHPAGLEEVTSITLTLPSTGKRSEPARVASDRAPVTFAEGNEALLEITFDHGAQGRVQDFRPALPLIFNY